MTNLAEQINNEESNVFVFPRKKPLTKTKKTYKFDNTLLNKLQFLCNEDQKYETTIISDLIVEEYKKRKQKTEKSHNDIEANKTKLEEAFVFQQVIETQNTLIKQMAEIKNETNKNSSGIELEAIEIIKGLGSEMKSTLSKFQSYENGNLKMIEGVKHDLEGKIEGITKSKDKEIEEHKKAITSLTETKNKEIEGYKKEIAELKEKVNAASNRKDHYKDLYETEKNKGLKDILGIGKKWHSV